MRETSIYYAIKNDSKECFDILLSHGAIVNRKAKVFVRQLVYINMK